MTIPLLPEVLALASRAESEGRANLADALFAVAGRMGRQPGGDGYDLGFVRPSEGGSWIDEETWVSASPFAQHDPEPDHISAIRGRARLDRMRGQGEPAGANHHEWEA